MMAGAQWDADGADGDHFFVDAVGDGFGLAKLGGEIVGNGGDAETAFVIAGESNHFSCQEAVHLCPVGGFSLFVTGEGEDDQSPLLFFERRLFDT